MKIFFTKRTFSKQVLKWRTNLQQQHIASGDEPCRTWNGMKVVVQRHFDHPLEHPVQKINMVAMASEKHSLCTNSIVRSSLSDSIIGDAGLTPSKQQAIAIKPAVKKVAAGATNLHAPHQQVLPLSSKSSDSMDNIESDFSIHTKQNVRSSWITVIVGDTYLNMLQQQATMFQNDDKKMVPECSQSFIGKDQVMVSARNVTIPRDDYFKDVKQQVVASKVMHSVWSASILGDVNEIKQGATAKSALAENRRLHCKEQTLVVGTVSPCKDHGRYASVRDAKKDLIQSEISPELGKYVRPSHAAEKGDSFCTIAEKRLHKPQEKIHYEKEKQLKGCIFLSLKQREEVNSTANESNEEVPIDGLNLLVKKDENTNNVAAQKGQRWSVFQSECKIKDKVCKLVIDGGSFTNMINKDLVQRLSLSTWRHPTPHHMKWMNPVGKLKISYKVRVKFSVGSYIDKVECDIVPMDVCHLVLGRPWEYDLNATHEGRYNHYSFVHKGLHHVLKPMLECAINAEVFPTITKEEEEF
jgi:hypothetical protein